MRQSSEQPIWLRLRPSRGLLIYLFAGHLAAILALAVLQAPRWLTLPVALLVSLSLAREIRSHGLLRGRRAVRRLHWRSDGNWWVTDGEGRTVVYREHELHLRRPWLVVLRLKGNTGQRWLWLPGDAADEDVLRRLRVRLGRQLPPEDQADPLRGT